MPELPEVETFRRGLNARVAGKRVQAVELFRDNLIKNATPEELQAVLSGVRIEGIDRRGKYLIFRFSNGYAAVFHLRMTGGFSLEENRLERPQICFRFVDGATLYLDDRRNLSTLHLARTDRLEELEPIARLGIEPFTESYTFERFASLFETPREIKRLLVDQTRIAGLGNIYACEILFVCGIHPTTPANRLSDDQVKALYERIPELLEEAIRCQGTSITSYRDLQGDAGAFQERLRVYGREGEPCRSCGKRVERMKHGGRSSYFCPGCQPFIPSSEAGIADL
ncbi:MAG: bifunctional DNA-formamidopyrimidine glycosylase/DNA-(apurinic or apyrimidinic site) lyase [Candidatus Bipolaricaulia bacterium]